jgi:hypothetical protein
MGRTRHLTATLLTFGSIATMALTSTVAAAATPAMQYRFSPDPLAPSGSIAPSKSVPVTLTVLAGGHPASGAVAYLSYSTHPGNDGAATVSAAQCGGTTALGSTQVRCITGADGTVRVTYRAPTHRYVDGAAIIQAQNQPDHPSIRIRTFYLFSLLYEFTTSPIARAGSLAARANQSVTLLARSAAGTGLASEPVYMSFHAASGGGSVTVASTGVAVSGIPKQVMTDAQGQITLTYHAPALLPASGIDTITAQNRATAPARVATSAYAFAATTPSVSISDVSMVRGDAHPNLPAQFVVTLSNPQSRSVSVQYYTSCGIGDKGCKEDILQVLTPKILTIPAGASSGVITITVYTYAAPETWIDAFFVHLANPVGAVLGRALGAGSVIPDRESSTGAVVSIGDFTIVKPVSGSVAARFIVDMLRPQATAVSVTYATADGTAVSPGDYSGRSATVTIPAGATSVVVAVSVAGRAALNDPLTFTIRITAVSGAGAVLWRPVGTGVILSNP